VADLERDQIALLPADENERDAIVEIRAGTGGNETAIFAAGPYVPIDTQNPPAKTEDLESSASELGGLKEAMFRVSGESVFRKLCYESGVHRATCLPRGARPHSYFDGDSRGAARSSRCDVELKPEDLRIEVSAPAGLVGRA
jgi:peptide chain release factor 1